MLYKVIIYFAEKHEKRLIKELSKIEFGVATFCRKFAKEAIALELPNLAQLLLEHAIDEEKHGKMLDSLAYGRDRLSPKDNGRFVLVIRPNGEKIVNSKYPKQGKEITWDSVSRPGETFAGIFENFDGISQRYWALRFLFQGRKACEFDWKERVAFMQVLEEETQQFYKQLATSNCSLPLRAIASQIAVDEINHADYLANLLHFYPEKDLDKWRNRIFWAKLGLIFDLIKIWWNAN